ncbi:lytic polysaccharide monooxygenase [Burkholderia sp. FERM BP-3421]|jgi:chitin-binding protein|uniref:lytic polysaccharide monooxygenase n=1 Tax=Burkholderia sp. FERM BP-3421 TaxID=1494466 RepID=UPI00235F6B54|nr:lytic polysaccharide monooxygenase [Burkholderia sp. FERM BP-3421]WDD91870.1 lytic polysaccharide monooxygenase [Burkholderia sp. FERM BP-3421]
MKQLIRRPLTSAAVRTLAGALLVGFAAAAGAHGRITDPPSRIVLCTLGQNPNCDIDAWQANAMENGKFFPATQGGLTDPFAPADAKNAPPPPDGDIAGASTGGSVTVLDEQSPDRWTKVPLRSGAVQSFKWEFSAVHKTRRWNYFITRANWDPTQKLTRAQFEATPFCTIQNPGQPYWDPNANLVPQQPTIHQCQLPVRTGYQVILAVWEVADTAMGFYQVIDAYFTNDSTTRRPF